MAIDILAYLKYGDNLNTDRFIGRTISEAYNLPADTISAVDFHQILKRFFKITKFDIISPKKRAYTDSDALNIELDVDNNELVGTPEDIQKLGSFFPKTEQIIPYLSNYILELKGINSELILRQNILSLNLLGPKENTSKFLDFLVANKSINTYPEKFSLSYQSLTPTAYSAYTFLFFLENYEENAYSYLDINAYLFNLFINYLQLDIPSDMSRIEFNTLMSNLYKDYGFGVWNLNLNITRVANDFIADNQATYDALRKAMPKLEQWNDLINTISDFYRVNVYDNSYITIPLAVKLYKDFYGLKVF